MDGTGILPGRASFGPAILAPIELGIGICAEGLGELSPAFISDFLRLSVIIVAPLLLLNFGPSVISFSVGLVIRWTQLSTFRLLE